jgi:hypothetical protein
MKALALSLALSAAATAAAAQGRPFTPALPCSAAAGIVARSGAAVLSTGRATYDRFVADRRFCDVTEVTRPAYVPAADTPQCFVGYRCRQFSRDDQFFGFGGD